MFEAVIVIKHLGTGQYLTTFVVAGRANGLERSFGSTPTTILYAEYSLGVAFRPTPGTSTAIPFTASS